MHVLKCAPPVGHFSTGGGVHFNNMKNQQTQNIKVRLEYLFQHFFRYAYICQIIETVD